MILFIDFDPTQSNRSFQTLNDCIPEVKQAMDKKSRNAENAGHRGTFSGRGRGGCGGFAARGFTSASGGGPGRPNGDAPGAPEYGMSVGWSLLEPRTHTQDYGFDLFSVCDSIVTSLICHMHHPP